MCKIRKLSDWCFSFSHAMAYINAQESSFPLKLKKKNKASPIIVIFLSHVDLNIYDNCIFK